MTLANGVEWVPPVKISKNLSHRFFSFENSFLKFDKTFSLKWWQVLIGFSILHLTAGMIMSTVFQMAYVLEIVYQPII